MLQRKFDEIVKTHFPNAMDAKDTSIHYLGKMQIDHKIDISKVLMATSVCSDDINVPSTTFFNVLFGPFIMGGLGGLPFAGPNWNDSLCPSYSRQWECIYFLWSPYRNNS